ncbi:MAG TPA: nuclear transport factor 2 family protein [Acidimicrobiales bacterium]|nr:nuclear transport factor 2 family protein [Acidimicrobiales bacterium]
MTRTEIVRTAYQRINDQDFDGALDLCDPDIQFRDVLNKDGWAYGRKAVRQRFAERFSVATVHVTVGALVELGNIVIAAVCCQVYGPAGDPVGPNVIVTDRISFRGNQIFRVETTQFEDVPDEVRTVLLAGTTSRQT